MSTTNNPPTPADTTGPSRRSVLGASLAVGAALASGPVIKPGRANAATTGTPSPFQDEFATSPPFSFTYNGHSSAELLAHWPRTRRTKRLDRTRTEETHIWTSPDGLRVSCAAIRYSDFPAVEWVVSFKNTGATDSGQLADILAIDTALNGSAGSAWTIHTNHGSSAQRVDFQPLAIDLGVDPSAKHVFSAIGGKPTSEYDTQTQHAWPFYNIEWGTGGAIIALGWPGQWGLQITRDSAGAQLLGGMTSLDGFFTGPLNSPGIHDLGLADLYLQPREEIRTPLIVTLTWDGGDWIDAQNTWRRWLLRYNTPQIGDNPPAPIGAAAAAESTLTAVTATAADYISVITAYDQHGLTPRNGGKLGWLWIDTGWFPIPDSVSPQDPLAWTYTGTWEADPDRFPRGLREVTGRARHYGAQTIVWHEPERTRPGTRLCDTHPKWLLANGDPEWRYLDWGNPAAYAWAVDTFDGLIKRGGISLFRIDYNYIGPLPNWNATDPANRRGATQAHWVAGFLAFLDELRRRNPRVIIESCASGGRRLDLETMRRCVSLSRTDLFRDNIGNQCAQYGLSQWLVCHGGSADAYSTYGIRSAMGWHLEAHLNNLLAGEPPTETNWATLKSGFDEWASIAHNYFGDFYPLTTWSMSDTDWLAYQYNRPDTDSGLVQAFARDSTPPGSLTVRLRGLLADKRYLIRDLDFPGKTTTYTGAHLMTTGLTVTPASRPHASTLTYERAGR